ncbi:MAG: sugar ABC transporter permease [Clostridia bacterium]|nr:sugar ABC transporter permease [Clostridia bacterium]
MLPHNNSQLEYLKLSGFRRAAYNLRGGLSALPKKFLRILQAIPRGIQSIGQGIASVFRTIVHTFRDGDAATRLSYFIMGYGQLVRGQILRGVLYFFYELIFVLYMVLFGWRYLLDMRTLGDVASETYTDPDTGLQFTRYVDNSLLILLYGTLTLFFVLAFLYVWYRNCKENGESELRREMGLPLPSAREDIRALTDKQYYKTLLALPLSGIVIFTVIPIVFMVLIAFTNYDAAHLPPSKLFDWVGLDNFAAILGGNSAATGGRFGYTFGQVLIWTLIWAFFATFTNYFLGMLVAILINKKGVRGKSIFRTILVLTIAVPQFVSLLLVSRMFADDGIVNGLLQSYGLISERIPFLSLGTYARVMVILINIWVGVPYIMLVATGILLNIPAELYESARIDGAGPFRVYRKITLPYMLFVTTPYLITTFIGNINNFGVIYLLTGGGPSTLQYETPAGYTDLLITWLYKLTMAESGDYKMASVIGIMVFVLIATFSLLVYNNTKSVRNEDDFQ